MKKVVLVDDNHVFCRAFRLYFERHFPALDLMVFEDPAEALPSLGPSIDFLIIDWEMPGMDGAELLDRAVRKGVPKERIVILSCHPAKELHRRFALGSCLAVLEKFEGLQKSVLDMILRFIEDGGKKGLGETPVSP